MLAAAAGSIAVPHIRWLAILPVVTLLGGAVVLLAVASLVRRPLRLAVSTGATVVLSLTAFGFAWWQWADVQSDGPFTAIDHAVAVDGFSVLFTVLVTSAMVMTALVADGYLRREGVEGPEMHVLALVSASGAILMAQANDLVIVFLGLEILSIALYVLAAFNHRRTASGEAALKYFILGGFSSAIFVYGIALTYGATGSTNLTQIAGFLSRNVITSNGVLLAGMALLLVGFCFKIAAVPFHMWTPDVYQGAPSPITGFMAAVAKAGAFAALLRIFISTFGVLRLDWQPVIYAIAVVTLLLGAILAVVQRDVKRMLAYSSINHAGFILLGLQAASTTGVSAALYYLFAYSFMVIGSFAVVTVIGRKGDGAHDLAVYRGLASRQPVLAFSFTILLLAQAGVPFTTGFLAKLQVVAAAVDANSVPLAVIAMVTAAIAAFFYLRLAVLMYTPLRTADAVPGVEPIDPFELGLPAPEPVADGRAAGNGHALFDGADHRPLWEGTEVSAATTQAINAELLLDDDALTLEPSERPGAVVVIDPDEVSVVGTEDATEAEEAEEGELVPVPLASAVAIGICLAVTVVFGIIPAPLIDFAQHARLLFFP